MNKILKEIKVERQNQIDKGFDANHDDKHARGELIDVAVKVLTGQEDPWGIGNKHRGYNRRKMIIAIALLVAEVERRDRDTKLPPEVA